MASDLDIRVGMLTASMSRQAGGLFWAVKALSKSIAKAGSEVQVFAGEDRYSADDLGEWGNLPVKIFPRRGPSSFGYQKGLGSELQAANLAILHLHGLWAYPSVAAKAWSRKKTGLIISPHGMLDPWAVRNSRWKKRVAASLYERSNLNRAACIHALCDSELKSIRAYGLTNPVALIPNGVDLPEAEAHQIDLGWGAPILSNVKVLLFLSRIHPKKGLVNLLRAWAKATKNKVRGVEAWRLVIAGWDDQGSHLLDLRRLTKEIGVESSVSFVGPQFGASKAAALRRADAFILPSVSEGLPMAVLEAWSHGLPVLITPQCNLPEGFAAGAAIRIDPEADGIEKGLRELLLLGDAERKQMGARGRKLVEDRFSWSRAGHEMVNVYRWVFGVGSKPECVQND